MARLRDSRERRGVAMAEARNARALAESEERFRTLADTMPQMVWSTLPDGFHDYYNARWYEFTGVPAGLDRRRRLERHVPPRRSGPRLGRCGATAWTTGDPYQIEYRLRHFDGTYRWVLGRALPIRDESGAITRWFGTCTDIHEQKLALEEREVHRPGAVATASRTSSR